MKTCRHDFQFPEYRHITNGPDRVHLDSVNQEGGVRSDSTEYVWSVQSIWANRNSDAHSFWMKSRIVTTYLALGPLFEYMYGFAGSCGPTRIYQSGRLQRSSPPGINLRNSSVYMSSSNRFKNLCLDGGQGVRIQGALNLSSRSDALVRRPTTDGQPELYESLNAKRKPHNRWRTTFGRPPARPRLTQGRGRPLHAPLSAVIYSKSYVCAIASGVVGVVQGTDKKTNFATNHHQCAAALPSDGTETPSWKKQFTPFNKG